MKTVQKSLKAVADKIMVLSEKIDKLAQLIDQSSTVGTGKRPKVNGAKTPKLSAKSKNVLLSVFETIKSSSEGVKNSAIIEQTGLTQKQIYNALVRLKKQGKIKTLGRGIYSAV